MTRSVVLWKQHINTEDGAAVVEYIPAWSSDETSPNEHLRQALLMLNAIPTTPMHRAIRRRIELAVDQLEVVLNE